MLITNGYVLLALPTLKRDTLNYVWIRLPLFRPIVREAEVLGVLRRALVSRVRSCFTVGWA
jgi:hypothetical protein